jgi:hypothetical protein
VGTRGFGDTHRYKESIDSSAGMLQVFDLAQHFFGFHNLGDHDQPTNDVADVGELRNLDDACMCDAKCRIHLSQRQIMLGADLIDRLSHPPMPDDDVLDRDASPGNAGLAARNSRSDLDVSHQYTVAHWCSLFLLAYSPLIHITQTPP